MNDLTIYSDEELKLIHNLELNCLKAIIGVCERYGIEYFLVGGSALGAVRHGGFIPWDDDIDIGMTRENYDKFLTLANTALPINYHLQTPKFDANCPYYYSKVRIDGTEFVEYCNRNIKMHQGVYVDIFPFDEVPDEEHENIKQFQRIQRLIRLFTLRQSPDVASEPKFFSDYFRAFFRRRIHRFFKCFRYDRLISDLELEFTKYNGSGQSCVACLNFPVRKTEYIKWHDLYPLTDCDFEDIIVKIPNNYDAYLKTHYGDYMQLPPSNKRFGHKPYKVFLEKQ